MTTSEEPVGTVTIPSTIADAQRSSVDDAIHAWRNSMRLFDESLMKPGDRDWELAIRKYSNDPAAAIQLDLVDTFVKQGIHQVGNLKYVAAVTKATVHNVQLQACVDASEVDVLDANGQSASKDGPRQFTWTFSVSWYPGDPGSWMLNDITRPDPVQPC